jgi:ribonuclease P protein component
MSTLTLPKNYLLRKKDEYENVYLHGKRVHGEHFSLILLPNNRAYNRLGISIHGQLKGVARRNRIKRIIREFFRLNKDFLQEKITRRNALPFMDIVMTVRKGFNQDNPADIATAITTLLDQKAPVFL